MACMRVPPAQAARSADLVESVPGAEGSIGAVAAAGSVPSAARRRPHTPMLLLLALGHLVVDMNQGAMPALLPFLRTKFGLTYAAAGTVILVANVSSSVIQPIFGYLADRTARSWLLPWAIVVAALGVALAGLAPSYGVLLVLVVVAGFGIAAYHPEGYKTANQVAGDRKATGLSLFSIGGNVGIALGPPVITALVGGLGLLGTLAMLGPGVLVAALIASVLPGLIPAESGAAKPGPSRTAGATCGRRSPS